MVGAVGGTCLALASEASAGPGTVEHITGSALSTWESEDRRKMLEERVTQAQRDELVPWLLGHSDPIRERVEARERKLT
jgi:hypothetical protein